jgi:hypothetical protein
MTAGAFFRDLKDFTGDGGEGYDDEEPKPLTISGEHIYILQFFISVLFSSFGYIHIIHVAWAACKTDIIYLISLKI